MLKYVVEEVDRLKAMYEERLARAAAERSAVVAAEKQASERLSAAEVRADKAAADAQAATCSLAELTQHHSSHAQQLKAELPALQLQDLGVLSKSCNNVGVDQDGSHCYCLRSYTCAALGFSCISGERLSAMQAAEAKEKAAEEAAAQRAAEAAGAQRRVAEVEREMQALLAAMERQKRASAVKVIAGSPALAWPGDHAVLVMQCRYHSPPMRYL